MLVVRKHENSQSIETNLDAADMNIRTTDGLTESRVVRLPN
jgi:hypothetical protein